MIDNTPPDRNLALEIVRVTEAAALASTQWVGRGQKESADGAAVNAMRSVLDVVSMDGTVIIGEGEKDNAPMLFNGEHVGDGTGPKVDIAVDPIEGTTPTAMGRGGAMSVIAIAGTGSMFFPGPIVYMDKLATGPDGVGVVSLDLSPRENVAELAKARHCQTCDITVAILDRPRHQELIEEVRAAGARIFLIGDGDVAAALLTALPSSNIDMLLGVGGSPEAVIAAAGLQCVDGAIQARLWPRDELERQRALDAGYNLDKILHTSDLVNSQDCFFAATGVTDSELLRGVRTHHGEAITHSIVMRSRSKTVRTIEAVHRVEKLKNFHLIV
ncbi:class II fructose-bisphosphatase [Ferrimicrobium sp.]|uniref:class II fructose-bisphosphatase n=1 Tax=Ferrimicrobium sp. TaxID=2926050 RepID=UPI002604C5F8|nr:class II fructose-bisphosphatase [Ferrimicrobium sp.]